MAQGRAIDRRTLVAKVFLFSELSPEELDVLVQYTHTKRIAATREVFHKGDRGDEMYAILSGRLKAAAPSPDGKQITFSIMDPGEVFGEIAMLGGVERTATVSALEPSELLVIQRRDLIPLLKRHPEIVLKLLSALVTRIRKLSQLVEDRLFLNLPSRLAKKLLSLSESYGQDIPGGTRLALKLSQGELGDMLGTSRESINKQIRAWEREGLVTMAEGHITIHKPEALDDLAKLVSLNPIP